MPGARHWLPLLPFSLLATAALALAATAIEADRIEAELTTSARQALSSAGLPPQGVSFAGRDATVHVHSPAQARQATEALDAVPGVRTVRTIPADAP